MKPLSKLPGHESGLSMIEVLVAVLVLGIGLLGVAGLQSLSLKNTTDVFFDQQAQSAADDLLNRISANTGSGSAGALAGDYADTPPTSEPSPDCSAAACSVAEMAAWDLWQWNDSLVNGFGAPPSAAATVTWVGARDEYQIAITWDSGGAGAAYAAPTCTAADNTSPGCYFTVYRLR